MAEDLVMAKECCRKCKFWDHYIDDNCEISAFGDCRRYPPVLIEGCSYDQWMIEDPEKASERFRHPATNQSWWCGEFKPKDTE